MTITTTTTKIIMVNNFQMIIKFLALFLSALYILINLIHYSIKEIILFSPFKRMSDKYLTLNKWLEREGTKI